MRDLSEWQGLPYHPISLFYRRLFKTKIWKIPVSVAETCPNREGLNGMKTCNFCDVWGSAAYPEFRDQELRVQIEKTRARLMDRYNVDRFLVYFQAYTNTFTKVARLKRQFEIGTEFSDVVGFVVGTRPDCISDAVLDLWNEISNTHFVAVELGAQTFNEEQLVWMRRGHTAMRTIQAVQKIKKQCPKVDLGVHLMFGLPGETDEQIVETAKLINALPIDNVKLHNLHVLEHTPLAEDYRAGLFEPLAKADYARRVVIFLQHLNPKIAVHRLAAVASRHDELVAPDWAARKLDNYQFVLEAMRAAEAYQGQLYVPQTQWEGAFRLINEPGTNLQAYNHSAAASVSTPGR